MAINFKPLRKPEHLILNDREFQAQRETRQAASEMLLRQPKAPRFEGLGPNKSILDTFARDASFLSMRNFGEYLALLRVQNLIAPNMRYSPLALSAAVGCLGWPAQVNNPQHALRVRGAPKLLLVNALHDPATGYIWALNAAAQLGDAARLVTYEGWGHGTYGRGDCPTGIMDAYLVSGTLPRPGTRCPAVPPEAQAITAQLKGGLPMPNGPRPAIPGWG